MSNSALELAIEIITALGDNRNLTTEERDHLYDRFYNLSRQMTIICNTSKTLTKSFLNKTTTSYPKLSRDQVVYITTQFFIDCGKLNEFILRGSIDQRDVNTLDLDSRMKKAAETGETPTELILNNLTYTTFTGLLYLQKYIYLHLSNKLDEDMLTNLWTFTECANNFAQQFGVAMDIGKEVEIMNNFFKGKRGKITKVPELDVFKNVYKNTDESVEMEEGIFVDMFHVELSDGRHVNFLEIDDIKTV